MRQKEFYWRPILLHFIHNEKFKLLGVIKNIQSNLCTTTTLGTGKKWSLFKGGHYSEGQAVKNMFLIKKSKIKNKTMGRVETNASF
jgi:hypothetical protein